jgi:hypothetical protein
MWLVEKHGRAWSYFVKEFFPGSTYVQLRNRHCFLMLQKSSIPKETIQANRFSNEPPIKELPFPSDSKPMQFEESEFLRLL